MTIHDVPDHTRDVLAARAGMSLQEYVRAELNALAERPSPDEFWERVRTTGTRLPADVILEARDLDRR